MYVFGLWIISYVHTHTTNILNDNDNLQATEIQPTQFNSSMNISLIKLSIQYIWDNMMSVYEYINIKRYIINQNLSNWFGQPPTKKWTRQVKF